MPGRMVKFTTLLFDRYGWPGELRRPSSHRVKALDWQLERFAEMCVFDQDLPAAVIRGQPFHMAMIIWRYETGREAPQTCVQVCQTA